LTQFSPAASMPEKIGAANPCQWPCSLAAPYPDPNLHRQNQRWPITETCPACGAEILENSVQCNHCGGALPQTGATGSRENATTDALKKANRKIKAAWITGLILGIMALLLFIQKLDFAHLIIAVWFLGFSYGTYKKERISAISLLIIPVIGLITSIIVGNGALYWIPIGLIMAIPFYLGVRGVFAYHKLIKASQGGSDKQG
jgi:hypothetical protein